MSTNFPDSIDSLTNPSGTVVYQAGFCKADEDPSNVYLTKKRIMIPRISGDAPTTYIFYSQNRSLTEKTTLLGKYRTPTASVEDLGFVSNHHCFRVAAKLAYL
jgi:hypothetical protein